MSKEYNLNDIRYESTFTELPLIGKIPRFICGDILKTKYGDLDLSKQSCNFFTKLTWHQKRTFEITEVECVKDTCVGAYPIKKGEICKVKSVKFSDSSEYSTHDLVIERKSKKFGDAFIWYSACYFIPTKYKILSDEVFDTQEKR